MTEKIRLYNDDCLNALKKMEDNSIDSCVTDPPYGLSFMGKSWDYDVPQKEIWQEVLRVLKPGGHLLAFFGSRTYHRGVVQIEDAGFEVRDQIMWLYGSGFPKSHNIGKAIDAAAGATRQAVGKRKHPTLKDTSKIEESANAAHGYNTWKREWDLTAPATDEAAQWEGWGTALKPAHEPIVVARKPITQTVAKNVLEYGTGALNIDGCRVGFQSEDDKKSAFPGGKLTSHGAGSLAGPGSAQDADRSTFDAKRNVLGRWPANVIHDGSDEVVSVFPDTGKSGVAVQKNGGGQKIGGKSGIYGGSNGLLREDVGYNDSGSAARFFYSAKASKADRGEGNNHPTVKPTELMKYLCRLVTPKGGIVLDPFMGSGSTGKAALQEGFKFIGIEMSKEYFEIAKNRVVEVSSGLENFFEEV